MKTNWTNWKHVAGAGVMALVLSVSARQLQAASVYGYGAGYGGYGAPQYGGQGPGGWDQPPGDVANDVGRQGFHDGIEGARKDYENHRRPDVNNRDEFRHPSVARGLRHDYREGFRRGYDVGVQHLSGGDRDHDHDHDGDRH